MPYISVTIGQKFEAAQKEKLKAELGRLITIIPGKTEPDLIVHTQDSASLNMGGEEGPSVYIDLRIYTKTEKKPRSALHMKSSPLLSASSAFPAGDSTLPSANTNTRTMTDVALDESQEQENGVVKVPVKNGKRGMSCRPFGECSF